MRLILSRSPLHHTIAALSLVIGSARGFAQQVEGTPPVPSFDKTEVMVPMRDGVKLHTNVFVPRGFAANLPIILVRTPYGSKGRTDVRGRLRRARARRLHLRAPGHPRPFKSEGQFVMLRKMRDKKDPKAIDEATDTYDTIEWLLKNVPRTMGASA
jgi:predicted acyl esterase